MNCFPQIKQPTRALFRTILCLCFVATTLPGLAQTRQASGPTNQLSSERFLLILDISSAMQKRATNVLRTVGQVFASGFYGQLHRGDTIGMWTYNDTLHTGEFPLQRWTPQSFRQITSLAVQFTQNQRYSKRSNLSPVMAQLTNVVAGSEKITVILLSDGSESLTGTPFDEQISDAFKLNADEQRRQAMPFVAVLRAVKGKFVSFKVSTPPWPIEIPAFPVEPVAANPEHTNSPPAKVENSKPVTPVAVAEPKPTSTEINNPTPTPPIPAVTNPPALVESKPTPAETSTNPPPAVTTTPPPLITNIAKTDFPPTNVAEASSPPQEMPLGKPARNLPSAPILVGAGIVLAGLAIVCVALLRRSRETTHVSLITRSMNKDRK